MTEHTNESRSLVISDFRNLGVSDTENNVKGQAVLKLNRSLEKNRLGGIVTILGGNNSGKSNVLSALTKVRKGEFDDNDRTDFAKAPRNPSVSFSITDGRYGELAAPQIVRGKERCTLRGKVSEVLLYILRQKESFELYREFMTLSPERADDIEGYMNNNDAFARGKPCTDDSKAYSYILRHRTDIQCADLAQLTDVLDNGQYESMKDREITLSAKGTRIDEVVFIDEEVGFLGDLMGMKPQFVRKDRVEEFRRNQKGLKTIAKLAASIMRSGKEDSDLDVKIIDFAGGIKETVTVPDEFSARYGYNLGTNVYQYSRRKISDQDFECSSDRREGFIPGLFASLGYDVETILSESYLESANTIKKLEDEVNTELAEISDTFNRLLNFGNRPYSMSMRIGDRRISFSLRCGNTPLRIDHQSEGFRWIFEFFLNFLLSKKFVAGDIIVVDEYGGLLNPGTVRELTRTLREFGKNNGLTFVLATQNPMAVDISRLEEVRIVAPREDGSAVILNDFTEFFGDSTDAVKPVTDCLTVGRGYLRGGKYSTVFVGSDYDYFLLNAMNRILGTDVDVIPVNGDADDEELAKVLLEMEHSPILLSDKDEGFVSKMKDLGVTVVSAREFGKTGLEDLLSDEDMCKVVSRDGNFDEKSTIADNLTEKGISETTSADFKEFIDYISM
ncbi:MAG: hypothetical protein MJZ21_00050 [archaeon]|nr:hypothetical protein [archaeon]